MASSQHQDAVETALRTLLKEKPRNAKAMARLACLLVERAKSDASKAPMVHEEAVALAQQAIQIAPDRPMGYLALSVASNIFAERMQALVRAIDLSSCGSGPFTMTAAARAGALVRLLVETREEESRNARETKCMGGAASSHPTRRDMDDNERSLYKKIEDAMAIAWGRSDASSEESIVYLGRVEYRLGLFFRKMQPALVHRRQSRKHLRNAFERLPQDSSLHQTARFWLATSQDDDVHGGDRQFVDDMDRCPEGYVISLYATFAAKFDEILVDKLQYETPTRMKHIVDDVVGPIMAKTKWSRRAADLGCGTGLSGIAFRQCVHHLIGVDLSPAMVAKALERGCYDDLFVGDVSSILDMPSMKFDLILACDVFVYIGDLRKVFSSVRKSLATDGIFAFSTEFLDDHVANSRPYILQSCARFAHKRRYIEELLAEQGLEIAKLEICPIRKNNTKDVIGLLVVSRLK